MKWTANGPFYSQELIAKKTHFSNQGPIYKNSTDEEDPYGFKENYLPRKKEADKKERMNWVLSLTDKEFEWHRKQHQMLHESKDKGVQAIADVTSTISQYRTGSSKNDAKTLEIGLTALGRITN